jgi:(E)-4-hydroxy-3-methylbut-2-enyl-diphosphate synthase
MEVPDKHNFHPFHYRRRKTRVVYVGDVGVGGDNPIRVQSMTIADTLDTKATVDEIERLVEVGCEIVRVTAPSIKEAENLRNIKAEMARRKVRVPLVADIHYTPNAALVAAEYVEKVRINPGNYADKKRFEVREYTDEEYQAELRRIEERFTPLVLKCKKLGRAMRIGTNHGSLSDRIMNRYGDTPLGMVESALEFLRICRKHDYHDIILSMKASNVQVMIQAYRLLAMRLDELGWDYPFHLGVTEAGGGEDGRIKSAIGIGALLEDGIGDTIRVSLTEDSWFEVPVAFAIAERYRHRHEVARPARERINVSWDLLSYERRSTRPVDLVHLGMGGDEPIRVEMSLRADIRDTDAALAEIAALLGRPSPGALPILGGNGAGEELRAETVHIAVRNQEEAAAYRRLRPRMAALRFDMPVALHLPDLSGEYSELLADAERVVLTPPEMADRSGWDEAVRQAVRTCRRHDRPLEWSLDVRRPPAWLAADTEDPRDWLPELAQALVEAAREPNDGELLLSLCGFRHEDAVHLYRALFARLDAMGARVPVVLRYSSSGEREQVVIDAAIELGSLLCDGLGDAIHLDIALPPEDRVRIGYNILQGARLRISKTEYISCPSCGRTLFNLQTTTERIQSKTAHLKGVKIAVMGCIVNGPGEMADADFGYVGAGPKKVNLFVGKECVERNIPEEIADERLIELIKAHGKWVEPPKTGRD